jgi:hypothetical protein
VPFARINGLMSQTRLRAQDKSSAVRRRALQLAAAMMTAHPYRVGDGQLRLSALEAAHANVATELEVGPPMPCGHRLYVCRAARRTTHTRAPQMLLKTTGPAELANVGERVPADEHATVTAAVAAEMVCARTTPQKDRRHASSSDARARV